MSKNDSVLIVVAHSDDEVLGCGGYIAKLADEGKEIHLLVISDGESSRFNKKDIEKAHELIQKRNKALLRASKILGIKSVEQLNFPDNRLDSIDLLEIIKEIEKRVLLHKPELVITHYYGDLNLDHRIINEAACVACRPTKEQCVKEIIFFEVPSSTEWQLNKNKIFSPNYFIDISNTIEKKIEALKCYEKELRNFPHPRSIKSVNNLAMFRGSSAGLNYAEAFIIGRKII